MSSPENLLLSFLVQAAQTPQLGATHISLFAALVGLCNQQGGEPVRMKRRDVMALAKISPATYHKCLRALIEGGFLVYYPCSDPRGKSEVYFVRDPIETDFDDENVHLEK